MKRFIIIKNIFKTIFIWLVCCTLIIILTGQYIILKNIEQKSVDINKVESDDFIKEIEEREFFLENTKIKEREMALSNLYNEQLLKPIDDTIIADIIKMRSSESRKELYQRLSQEDFKKTNELYLLASTKNITKYAIIKEINTLWNHSTQEIMSGKQLPFPACVLLTTLWVYNTWCDLNINTHKKIQESNSLSIIHLYETIGIDKIVNLLGKY